MMSVRAVVALMVGMVASGCASERLGGSDGACAGSEDAIIDAHIAELREMVEGPEAERRPRVLVLGMFHFQDAGLDAHTSAHVFDVFSEEGQREVEDVRSRLQRFNPTKILVERPSRLQADIDAWYEGYLAGNHRDNPNEIITIGFELAQRLGHDRVYGFDAAPEWLATAPETPDAFLQAARRVNAEWAADDPMNATYLAMYRRSDDIEAALSLRQRVLLMNDPEMLRLSHGSYFFYGGFRAADGVEFPGPDSFASAWHNRNLRMFSNIQRLAEPGDRVLVIVGAGHVPILQQCVQSCPTMEWVPVREYFGLTPPVAAERSPR
jgi:hypothetical protein